MRPWASAGMRMSRHLPRAVLLDTHVWLWLINADPTLSVRVRRAVTHAAVESRVLVSAISVWEVGMLEAKGRIRLGKDCEAWVREALALPGVRLVPVDERVALSSTRLPGDFHGDPADRLLVATARAVDATLATRDAAILAYGREGYVRTIEA